MANRLFATLKESVAKFVADDAMSLSASIAYYAAFALAPLLLIAVSFAGIFFGEEAVTGASDWPCCSSARARSSANCRRRSTRSGGWNLRGPWVGKDSSAGVICPSRWCW